ncbi:hypothetical protein Bca52824_019773 [Brassica carinata]|uniref:BAH domain-containing protein n=1 Tax=Brassica carinata TaxID=52824 RepID=A0A8X7VS61_BRACI|nr:hypothetical protein Bca52824_019773 [Brassica carinata]
MMEKSVKVDGLPFKWGKKKGPCVENKDVQYYESFTYGGCEYCLYDCVSVEDDSKVDSREFFVGKIIKMWEYTDQRQDPRRVELLWFFKPSELSLYLEGVQDVLANELFLASGSGLGLTNENLLQVLKWYSKELPDMNYASNTQKGYTFLEKCVSKRKYCSLVLKSGVSNESFHFVFMIVVCYCRPLQVTRTLFLPYDLDTEPRSSTLVHLIEVSRSALTMPETSRLIYHAPASDSEKAPYVAKANGSQESLTNINHAGEEYGQGGSSRSPLATPIGAGEASGGRDGGVAKS